MNKRDNSNLSYLHFLNEYKKYNTGNNIIDYSDYNLTGYFCFVFTFARKISKRKYYKSKDKTNITFRRRHKNIMTK